MVMAISVCGTSTDGVPLLEIGPSYSSDAIKFINNLKRGGAVIYVQK